MIISSSQKWLFVVGNPMPVITWHKDGQLLQEDDTHHIMSGGRFLQITNAQVSHTGRYTCLASNTAGDKSKSFSLNVLGRYIWNMYCVPGTVFYAGDTTMNKIDIKYAVVKEIYIYTYMMVKEKQVDSERGLTWDILSILCGTLPLLVIVHTEFYVW